MQFLFLLAMPFAGAVFLAVQGAKRWAPDANAAFSFATLVAAAGFRVVRRWTDAREWFWIAFLEPA